MTRAIQILLLVLAGLPLIAYPFVLMANLMGLAGFSESDTSAFHTFSALGFMLSTTLYPAAYLFAVVMYVVRRKEIKRCWKYVLTPYAAMVLIAILFLLWASTEQH